MLNHQIDITKNLTNIASVGKMPYRTGILHYDMDRVNDRFTTTSPVKRGNDMIKAGDSEDNEPQKKEPKLCCDDDTDKILSHPYASSISTKNKDARNTGKVSTIIASNSTKSVGILHYNDRDVLSGRGGGTNLHPGNRYYRELILSQCSAYEEASKTMKPEISRQIIRKIREKGGRFLRKSKTDGMYFEIDESTARGKTSQALRHRSFEFRNVLDPKRMKMNGRWKKNVKVRIVLKNCTQFVHIYL